MERSRLDLQDPRVLGLCLLGFALLVWLPSLANGFVWDDVNNLVSSDRLTQWSAFLDVFRHDAMWSAERQQAAIGTYRPIALASFVLDFQLYGRRAMGFHFSSIFWHAMATIVLFRAFLRWASPMAAFAMAALWCAHPVCVEATAWINGRSEVFAVLFGAGALACATAPRLTPLRYLGTLLCLMGALLSKEAGLIFFPVVVWLAGEADGRADRRRVWARIHWPIFGVAVVALFGYGLMRVGALSGGVLPGVKESMNEAALGALAPVWGRSLQTALLPLDRSLQHLSLWLGDLPDFERFMYVGISALLLAWGVTLWFRGRRVAAVGLAWWLGALVPVALIAVKSWPGYYRWLVIGMPGLLLAVYRGFRGVIPARTGAVIASLALVAAVALTERSIPVWRSGGSLFGAMVEEQPHVAYGYIGLGAWQLEVGRAAQAERTLRAGTELKNPRPDAFLFLARAIAAQARCDEGVAMAQNRIAGRIPGHVAYTLGRCYEVTEDFPKAVIAYGKCADYVPACADRLPIVKTAAANSTPSAPAPATANSAAAASAAPATEAVAPATPAQ